MIATSLPFAKEHEQRADLGAEVANTSSGGGLMKSPKADFREAMRNAARLLSSGSRRAFTSHARHPSINEADGCARREADGYLLSLPSYPLLFEKTRLIGNMFQVNLFVHDWD